MIIKLKFIKNGEPGGREYSYYCNDAVAVDDKVIISGNQQGKVTAINVPEIEIELFKDKVKTIEGIVKEEEVK